MYLPLSEYLERTELAQSAVTAFLARPGRSTTYVIWEGDLRAEIDANLRRRYAVPFGAIPTTAEPDPTKVPRLVKGWLATLLDEKFQRAFREPGSQVEAGDVDITSAAARVRTAMTQAANPDTEPRPELPLIDPGQSGVVKGGPLVGSNTTIFGFFDKQQQQRDDEGW